MNGRTRLHRFRQGIPINNGMRTDGVFVRFGMRDKTQNVSPSAEWVGLEERQKGEVKIPARP